jgi:phosphatidylserine/phosphatidylglycerophosphate/cardiolipin synthase-like enzyme
VAAARRGVKVRALLNVESMGHAITKINGRTLSFLQQYGIEAKMGQFGGVVHAKMMIIDDEILVLGSHNFSKAAFSCNQEASIIVRGRDEILDYSRYFKDIWDKFF